ncbi:MAG: GDSL-type esterase/lipase family protein, partial [Planctomycetes bacterium]|nr:GDSL-type esterase/lipase family protein [Planctomycetota bacterium]
VLMIGVNNFGLGDDSPADVALGVRTIIGLLETSFPAARIVLLGILPYGEQPDTPERRQVSDANTLLAELGEEHPFVDFYDIGPAFLGEDGSISPEIMADFLHPTEAGYVIFAEQLDPIIKGLYE